jgi:hypothetical protein
MTTVLDKLKEQLNAQKTPLNADVSLRRAFIVFTAHARKCYRYSAVKLKGSEGNTLLGRSEDEIVTVDCASLADALVLFLNDLTPDQPAKSARVGHAGGFATASNSRCFDIQVQGNIRMPAGNWGDTGRCIFSEHYFVETGPATRWYLDPCMFTQYSAIDDVMSWKLSSGGGIFNSFIKFIDGDANQVLIRVPLADPTPKPVGFESGMILFQAKDFKKEEFSALRGKLRNKDWTVQKYQGHADAAFARVHTLLREKAAITAIWPKAPW